MFLCGTAGVDEPSPQRVGEDLDRLRWCYRRHWGAKYIFTFFPSISSGMLAAQNPPLLPVPHSLTLSVCLSRNPLPAGSAHSDSRQGGRGRARRGLRHIRIQRRVIRLFTTYLKVHIVL